MVHINLDIFLIGFHLFSDCSNVTDEGIHHILTALPSLKTLILNLLESVRNIIPFYIDSVESNVQTLKLASFNTSLGHTFSQLKLLKNLRMLTIGDSRRMPTNEEIDAIVSGCARIKELHYQLEARDERRDRKYRSRPRIYQIDCLNKWDETFERRSE